MENTNILPTKTTAAQNKVALSYYRVRGVYFLAVIFASIIVHDIVWGNPNKIKANKCCVF